MVQLYPGYVHEKSLRVSLRAYILDGVLTAHEIQCSSRKINGMLLKLDFEKAYDSVS